MNELQIAKSENFGTVQCDIYRSDSDSFMTREQIGMALEYSDPRTAIAKIHDRHKERLDQFSVVTKLVATDGKSYATTVYNRKGVMEICRWSQQPKADDFVDWAWDVMDDVISGKARVVVNEPANDKLLRARAMLMNAQTRQYNAIMKSIQDKTKLSAIAVEVFGIRALGTVTGADVGDHLPVTEKHYTATEIGKRYGVSSQKVGKIANANGVKTSEYGHYVMDKSPHSAKEVESFRYNRRGAARIGQLLGVSTEITDTISDTAN